MGPFECDMDVKALREVAIKGGIFSYAAGVAYNILNRHRVGGLIINNHRTTLPLKKGLSSSAAVCVLVARAFNKIYDLKMTTVSLHKHFPRNFYFCIWKCIGRRNGFSLFRRKDDP